MIGYKGKVVELRRHFNMLALAQEDPQVKAWFGEAYRAVGPYFANKDAATGLTFEEQRLLLPEVLGLEADDKNFRAEVRNFYHTFTTRVPAEGVKLQVSLMNDNLPLSDTNRPQNLRDYLSYRHALNHPEVAKDQASAEKTYTAKFYLFDETQSSMDALKINDLEDKATVIYMKYKDDMIKLDQILTMLGVGIKGMKPEMKVLKFKEFAKKDSRMNEEEQKTAFHRFINVAEDRDLEYKYLIQEMIGAQYLKRVGLSIAFNESGETIAQDMEGAVIYFKNPKNSRELNLMKAKYQALVKDGRLGGNEDYLPKEPKAAKTKEEVTAKTE